MDERVRRRKSLREAEGGSLRSSWSGKEHYSSYDIRDSLKFSSSKVDDSLLIPRDRTYATGERSYKGGLAEPDMREQGLNKTYYKNVSPGYEGWARRKHSEPRDDGLIHPYRSRSRSRDRGRSRSRSQSWGRGRDSDRDGIKSRSRSRSRNRNRNRERDQSRSRSPFYDRRRESHRWNDKSGSGISSQICRDFAAGGCRRGSQCRFLHTDGMDGVSENDLGERWKSRPEPGHALRYGEEPGIQSWDKVTDSSYGDDNARNKSRGAIPCKNFVRGKCQWGASCRFSHHVGSSDNSAAKGVGNASFGHDRPHQGNESGKPLCKYFLAGKCNRENCWFSHDDSAAGTHERRPHDDGGRHSLSDKRGRWDGPTWDETQTKSDTAKGIGWSERVDANQSERMDNKWGPEGRIWGSPEWKEKASEKSSFISTQEWNEDSGRDLGSIKSVVAGNSNDKEEFPPISPGLESSKLDDISASSHARILTEEDSGQHLPMASVNAADVSMKSDTQQNEPVLKNSQAKAFSYDGLGEVKELKSTMNPEFITRKSPSQNGVGNLEFNQSLVSSDLRDNLFFSRPSNVQSFDLNGSGQVLSSSLNVQNHHESHQKEAAKTQEMQDFGARQSFFSSTSNGHVAQYFATPAVASSMERLINEQARAHMHASLNPLTAARIVSSLPPTMLIQSNPMGDGRGPSSEQKSGFPFEPKTQIPFEQFSPMSGDGIEPEETLPGGTSDSPKSKLQEAPAISELMQRKMPAVSELKEKETPAISEQKEQKEPGEASHKSVNSSAECERGKENVPKENGEVRAKAENGSGSKDDKDMRLFKNALVDSVKEMLKPTWKLGKMSREVHKTIVKKVVDKVTGTIQADHIPKTQEKIDQYLSHAKTKISKLVQAYVDRHLKSES